GKSTNSRAILRSIQESYQFPSPAYKRERLYAQRRWSVCANERSCRLRICKSSAILQDRRYSKLKGIVENHFVDLRVDQNLSGKHIKILDRLQDLLKDLRISLNYEGVVYDVRNDPDVAGANYCSISDCCCTTSRCLGRRTSNWGGRAWRHSHRVYRCRRLRGSGSESRWLVVD